MNSFLKIFLATLAALFVFSILSFFMLFGFYFFLRAKQISPGDKPARHKRYVASAVSFGLMIASKYFPHYFGLNMLFHHIFHVRKPERRERAALAG